MNDTPAIARIDHINISMPKGAEEIADSFYVDVLGFQTKAKPDIDAQGRWYVGTGFEVHLGADAEFLPARRAHPAFVAIDLSHLVEVLRERGNDVDVQVIGGELTRAIVFDPFGNRIELLAK